MNKTIIAVMVMVVVVAVVGMVAQAISSTTLDAQKMSELSGRGCCEDYVACNACLHPHPSQPGTGSIKCTFVNPSYYECVDSPGTSKVCGTCLTWRINCGDLYECIDDLCDDCENTGACNGCDQVQGGDNC